MERVYFESVVTTTYAAWYIVAFLILYYFGIKKLDWLRKVTLFVLPIPEKRLLIFLPVLALIFLLASINQLFDKNSLLSKIAKKEFKTVSGCISNYETKVGNSRAESFKVANVIFKYNNVATSDWYFANRNNRDQFIVNGRCLTIHFIPEGLNNHIIKIIRD